MGHWNYRILKKAGLFAIHSVYYDDEGEIRGWSENPDPVIDEDIEYLKTQLALMLEATGKEILELETIEKKSKSWYRFRIKNKWFQKIKDFYNDFAFRSAFCLR
jgi:hypothetical protein